MAPKSTTELGTAGKYVLEDQVGHLLRRAHQRASAIFQEHMAEGLTPQQYAALIKVRDFGSVSQNRLGRAVAMDPATSQGVVQRLAAKHLVRRADDPKDRRRSVLSLTPDGKKLVETLIPLGQEITAEILEPLSRDEQATFLNLLKKLT
ncbi:MAG: MarR family transcriptional regulator [Alphaproteobacteria bacterium]|nr:MarR family transcriptional regulator [Alphaproteobacteria bacterium]